MKAWLFRLSFLITYSAFAQFNVALTQQAVHLFPSLPVKSSYTSLMDRRSGYDYLYSANMESGLGIYILLGGNNITPVLNLSGAIFNNLDAATIEQKGNSLFVGIGDFQVNNNAASGLAILDITNPASPFIKDIWDSTVFKHGISHILLNGNFAYLSTMTNGIIILDVSDENNIVFKSKLQLDLAFPSPSINAHNARGLKIKNDTLYVCFDRGGLRIVDVVNKSTPVEVYKYINTSLTSQAAAAYNDVAIKGNYAFISVDYCGLEILDISNIPYTTVQWYNPNGCSPTNWSGAAIHTNEVMLANNDSLLFVSGGQSEVLVFDVTNPLSVTKVGEFVNLNDTLATHGLDVYNNQVILSLIHTPIHIPPFTPFYADPGGLKLLNYIVSTTASANTTVTNNTVNIYQLQNNGVVIESPTQIDAITIYNIYVKAVFTATAIHLNKYH
ncbi:MAG TPA: hypothetical protein PLO59_02730, partial [Bacteroidia bacterium]|nr:hypothetical protein [Bacteroidia bacterium]